VSGKEVQLSQIDQVLFADLQVLLLDSLMAGVRVLRRPHAVLLVLLLQQPFVFEMHQLALKQFAQGPFALALLWVLLAVHADVQIV